MQIKDLRLSANHADLLSQELEHKKTFGCKFRTDCPGCGKEIPVGGQIIFLGQGRPICLECIDEMIKGLDEYIQERNKNKQ